MKKFFTIMLVIVIVTMFVLSVPAMADGHRRNGRNNLEFGIGVGPGGLAFGIGSYGSGAGRIWGGNVYGNPCWGCGNTFMRGGVYVPPQYNVTTFVGPNGPAEFGKGTCFQNGGFFPNGALFFNGNGTHQQLPAGSMLAPGACF